MLDDSGTNLTALLARQREALSSALAACVRERWTSTAERRSAAQGLARLGEAGAAYDLVLAYHSGALLSALRPLRPSRRDDDQGQAVHAAEVSHAVCSTLAAAVQDVGAAFPGESQRASTLLAWTHGAVRRWADTLMAEGAPCGEDAPPFHVAVAVRIALAHAALLERHGLALAPLLARLLRPRVSAVLERELATGTPGPELITAAEAYLRGGDSSQLRVVAELLVRLGTKPSPPQGRRDAKAT